MGSMRKHISLGICLWLVAGIQRISGLPTQKSDHQCSSYPEPDLLQVQPGPDGRMQLQDGIKGLYLILPPGKSEHEIRPDDEQHKLDPLLPNYQQDFKGGESVYYVKTTAYIPVHIKPFQECEKSHAPPHAPPPILSPPPPIFSPPPPIFTPAPPPLTPRFTTRAVSFPPHGNPYPYPPRTPRPVFSLPTLPPDVMKEGCVEDCP
ncbi:leucine-rich repeat extensin-like protein 1 [Drosophila miranda]|uniref:leucine-rich repeat extensin-like protein 1 n=1 Tax=Drosophila miranda TaxID=7229 RepID=UPI0007E60580|nr:leucine-rich repeat extensin-like protein 1 [Drosophila miranda]